MNRQAALKQLEIVRGRVLNFAQGLDAETADKQPESFNNTIRWNIGHVLTAAETFMFSKDSKLPSEYSILFGTGTKPSEWKSEAPSLEVLITQLQEQLERIKNIPAEAFEHSLPKPFLGLETVAELYVFTLYHEAEHLGIMKSMKRIVESGK